MCDVGDIFCPANITKSHNQITKGIAHNLSQGTMPMIMGGDHSIGDSTARGVDGKLGIIHLDRHVDTQEKEMDEIIAHLPVVPRHEPPELPAGEPGAARDRGRQVPRAGVKDDENAAGRIPGTSIPGIR